MTHTCTASPCPICNPQVCPTCGTCPTCGRRHAVPYTPYWPQPIYPPNPWWQTPWTCTITGGTVTSRVGGQTMTSLGSA